MWLNFSTRSIIKTLKSIKGDLNVIFEIPLLEKYKFVDNMSESIFFLDKKIGIILHSLI